MKEQQRALPSSIMMSELEQAKQRKAKLERLATQEESSIPKLKKREEKELSKREKVIERAQKDAITKYKDDIKASIAEDEMRAKIKKLKELGKSK